MTPRALGAERLHELAATLEAAVAIGRYEFNMSCWVGKDDDSENDTRHCGTAGCAMGFCPTVFPESWGYDVKASLPLVYKPAIVVPAECERYSLYYAASHFFGVKIDDAHKMFDPEEYPDPDHVDADEVISRIRQYADALAS